MPWPIIIIIQHEHDNKIVLESAFPEWEIEWIGVFSCMCVVYRYILYALPQYAQAPLKTIICYIATAWSTLLCVSRGCLCLWQWTSNMLIRYNGSMCVLACVCGCALGMLVYEIFNFQTFITSDNDSIIQNPFYTNVLSNVDDYDYHRLVISWVWICLLLWNSVFKSYRRTMHTTFHRACVWVRNYWKWSSILSTQHQQRKWWIKLLNNELKW